MMSSCVRSFWHLQTDWHSKVDQLNDEKLNDWKRHNGGYDKWAGGGEGSSKGRNTQTGCTGAWGIRWGGGNGEHGKRKIRWCNREGGHRGAFNTTECKVNRSHFYRILVRGVMIQFNSLIYIIIFVDDTIHGQYWYILNDLIRSDSLT